MSSVGERCVGERGGRREASRLSIRLDISSTAVVRVFLKSIYLRRD